MTTRHFLFLFLGAAWGCAGGNPASATATTPPSGGENTPSPLPDASAFVEASPGDVVSASDREPVAEVSDAATADAASEALTVGTCREQSPQDFLVRGHFLKEGPAGNLRAIQYRTDEYGYFKGFGHPAPGALPPSAYLEDTVFMGLHVKMHHKVVPALSCVEEEIERSCADHPYRPHALAGIRYRNTYRGGEVTNHAYGIAIDVDPALNTCCGCVKPWNDAPVCKRPSKNEYDRMAMPECWVHAFERYGFYWLGHDVLRDTMHFEFLGDPDKIGHKN
jgi:D-alanyl-D-alanine carboxypeptidase-like protein